MISFRPAKRHATRYLAGPWRRAVQASQRAEMPTLPRSQPEHFTTALVETKAGLPIEGFARHDVAMSCPGFETASCKIPA